MVVVGGGGGALLSPDDRVELQIRGGWRSEGGIAELRDPTVDIVVLSSYSRRTYLFYLENPLSKRIESLGCKVRNRHSSSDNLEKWPGSSIDDSLW